MITAARSLVVPTSATPTVVALADEASRRGFTVVSLGHDSELAALTSSPMTDEWRPWILDGRVHAASSFAGRGL